MSNFFTIKMI